MSWFSRLREWVRPSRDSRPNPASEPSGQVPIGESASSISQGTETVNLDDPSNKAANGRTDDGVDVDSFTAVSSVNTQGAEDLRIGLDFGTSTILVAVRIGHQAPRILRLESTGDELPSYLALSGSELLIGQAAVNSAVNVHSIKMALRENKPIEALGMKPDKAALHLISGGLARALDQLKRQGRLPPETPRLTVTSNVGCTPAFTLEERVRLRDVCRVAGLKVDMINLVEEPVAAAFFASREGGARDGRTMIIDAGGGTLDVSVLEVHDDATRFVLHASGGAELGGDRFTQLIVNHLKAELARTRGIDMGQLQLSRQEETALWNGAEEAKIALTFRLRHRVPLPGTEEVVEITREWFAEESRPLVKRTVSFVAEVYRRSRYTLDRSLSDEDQRPGTDVFRNLAGHLRYVRDLQLETDGIDHLDLVYFVGGASRMPLLRDRMAEVFGDKLMDLDVIGLDPVQAIVMGLAMHEPLDRVELRNPNWAVALGLEDRDGDTTRLPVYEPYAPLMKVGYSTQTPYHVATIPLPDDGRTRWVWLDFQSVLGKQGERWDRVAVPPGVTSVKVTITLFGDVAMWIGSDRVYVGKRSPFATRDSTVDWLPKGWRENWRNIVADYDPRYDAYK